MKDTSRKIAIITLAGVVLFAIIGWLFITSQTPEGGEGLWGGVDVNVIEKYAAEAGREAREPFINTDQGDLLLFVFTIGGAVSGFAAGYFWRRLISEKIRRD